MALMDLAPPAVEPIDLDYTKTFLRIDGDDENALLETLIKTARHQIENMIGRALINRRFKYRGVLPGQSRIILPRPPLVSVDALRVFDEDGVSADISTAFYTYNARVEPGELALVSGFSWSEFLSGACQIEIEFTAGYGPDPVDIPLPIRQAILLLVTRHFEHRDREQSPSVPTMVEALLAPYKWVRL